MRIRRRFLAQANAAEGDAVAVRELAVGHRARALERAVEAAG